MRQVVRDNFFDYSARHEGFTPFMYCDVLNLVTTGIGNLIDAGPNNQGGSTADRARRNNVVSAAAMQPALSLPWKHKAPGWTSKNPLAGGDASQQEIIDAWTRTKRQNEVIPDFSQRGGFAYAGLTDLTLDMDGLRNLFNRTLNSFDSTLASRYPGYQNWPADAQMALLSMSWAMGPAFNFPSFKAACDRLDFNQAAQLSFFKGGGGTLENRAGRNADNVIMFNNAADVLKGGLDLDRLFFPGTTASAGAIADGRGGNGAVDSGGVVPAAGALVAAGKGTIIGRVTENAIPIAAVGLIGFSAVGGILYAKQQGWLDIPIRTVKGWVR